MAKLSAGILLYRRGEREVEVLLVHPGGPFWAKKDQGAWTIPKGEMAPGEDALACARREFREETGHDIAGDFAALGECRQASGKTVMAWAAQGDIDAALIRSNDFELEWPPHSGKMRRFPEVDRAQWFSLAEAKARINKAQGVLLERLEELLSAHDASPST